VTGTGAPLRLEVMAFAPRMMDIRTRLPAQALAAEPDIEIGYQDKPPFRIPSVRTDSPRVAILQRPAIRDVESWRTLMAKLIRQGWVAVMEYDDDPELVSRVTGKPPNWERFAWPHAIQTSTEWLAEIFRRHNPEVAVFPNAVFDIPPFPSTERPPRIFYGALPRGAFAVEVARALAPALATHPETEVVVVGDRAIFDAMPTSAKRLVDYLPYERYLACMADCTILLTPLEPSRLSEAKSDAKFLDASSRGLLTIASPAAYARSIVDGETGLIARTIEDWPRLLRRALDEPTWAETIARRAWHHVHGSRMFSDQIPLRKGWYRDLYARREALNRDLMARLPGLSEALRGRRDQ